MEHFGTRKSANDFLCFSTRAALNSKLTKYKGKISWKQRGWNRNRIIKIFGTSSHLTYYYKNKNESVEHVALIHQHCQQ
ncbi:hypothetical protein PUN28_015966 [Cardiocondyla obscurior]|uniref:Uncharacterized protein n=1 Tax=Cardiocondyla obscurior TaxID=286306 RepID=A0AAW2EUK0_9HYME